MNRWRICHRDADGTLIRFVFYSPFGDALNALKDFHRLNSGFNWNIFEISLIEPSVSGKVQP